MKASMMDVTVTAIRITSSCSGRSTETSERHGITASQRALSDHLQGPPLGSIGTCMNLVGTASVRQMLQRIYCKAKRRDILVRRMAEGLVHSLSLNRHLDFLTPLHPNSLHDSIFLSSILMNDDTRIGFSHNRFSTSKSAIKTTSCHLNP
jgi:hypothetical protein